MTKKIIIPFIILGFFSLFIFETFSWKISDLQPVQAPKIITQTKKTVVTYSTELQKAYNYAYTIGITTQPSIQNADMYGTLIRSHMAKMMVNYAVEVLGQTADTSLACEFTDIANQSDELRGYIIESCQLGLMGAGITEFNPNGLITRAQFGTVLSRALYGDAYNGGSLYYTNHLNALKDAGIMNDISNPNAREQRGLVMLMMQRADTPSGGGSDDSENCDIPENVLSCSLGLDTCPFECGGSLYFSGKVIGANYELYLPSGTWKKTYNNTDTDYEYWDGNTLVQIRSEKYTTYNSSTLEAVVQDQIDTDKGRFRNYKQIENTTENIGGKNFGLITFQAKSHNSTATGVFFGFEKIYKDGDSYVYLYISTYSDTEQYTIDSILDSLKITTTTTNCNPSTEHKENSICVSNTKSCITTNSQGTQTWSNNRRGSCIITSCDYGYAMQYGSCVTNMRSCYIYNGTGQQILSDSVWGSCQVASCNTGYIQSGNACVVYVPTCNSDQHLANNTCVSNIQSCVVSYGIGQQIWNGSYWGSCSVVSCNVGYSIYANACYTTQSRACTITNGIGTQTGANNVYGSCRVVSCNTSYIQSGNTCIVYVPTCSLDQHLVSNICVSNTQSCAISNGVGQQTWNTTTWGSCLVSSCNAGYTIYGNVCYISQSRSCTISNGVGIQTGVNNIYGSCTVASCNSPYVQSGNTCIVYVPICSLDQHLVNNICVSNTQSCAISNGVGQQTWGSSRGVCAVVSCDSGYILNNNICGII